MPTVRIGRVAGGEFYPVESIRYRHLPIPGGILPEGIETVEGTQQLILVRALVGHSALVAAGGGGVVGRGPGSRVDPAIVLSVIAVAVGGTHVGQVAGRGGKGIVLKVDPQRSRGIFLVNRHPYGKGA